jgi:hypothetical protein
MTKRKQTPDVLAEILGGEALPTVEAEPVRPAAKDSSSMERTADPAGWEYTVVSFQEYKGWRPRFQDGRELKDWSSGPFLHEFLGQMAEQGWELAAASAGERLFGSADNHQLYFRRPR